MVNGEMIESTRDEAEFMVNGEMIESTRDEAGAASL
jgi:hypothetical protein